MKKVIKGLIILIILFVVGGYIYLISIFPISTLRVKLSTDEGVDGKYSKECSSSIMPYEERLTERTPIGIARTKPKIIMIIIASTIAPFFIIFEHFSILIRKP